MTDKNRLASAISLVICKDLYRCEQAIKRGDLSSAQYELQESVAKFRKIAHQIKRLSEPDVKSPDHVSSSRYFIPYEIFGDPEEGKPRRRPRGTETNAR